MEVAVDQVWATPSTLHVRILVFGPERRWRHKYYASVPIAEIPEEALQALQAGPTSRCSCDEHEQPSLF